MRILLTGGTGLIGRALCQEWAAKGHEVLVWSRQPGNVPALCGGAIGVGHLQELDDTGHIDAVINLAGAPIADRPWTQARREVLRQSRIHLTRTLVDWFGSLPTPPEVLISGSAVGWYGDGQDEVLDEASAPRQPDFGSELCMSWEHEALRAKSLGIRVVLLRTAATLSAQGGMLARLRLPFSLGLGGRLGDGRQWMPWIHIADEVGLIDFLMHRKDCEGPVNACAPQLLRNAEFTVALAAALHRPASIPMPAWVLKPALGEMSNLLLKGQRVQPRRALELGYQFKFGQIAAALENLFRRAN